MSRTIVLSVFTGLAILFAGAIAFELLNDGDVDAGTEAAAGADRSAPAGKGAPAPVAKDEDLPDFVEDILARPVFALNRKPPAAPAGPASPTAGPVDNTLPRLAGVIMTNDVKFAIFQPRDPAKPVSVEEGGEIAGRKVESIDFEEVVLVGPDGEERVHPTPDPAIEAAAAATVNLDGDAPPRRPNRPGVRPVVNRPGIPRPPGANVPGRPNPVPNSVRGRPPLNVRPGGRPVPPTPPNRATE